MGGKIEERGGAILTLNKLVLTFRGSYVCAKFDDDDDDDAQICKARPK